VERGDVIVNEVVVRTVCHGCRQVTQYRDDEGAVRPMVLPGSGVVFADKAPGVMVELPCPVCGYEDDDAADSETGADDDDSDDSGWVPGLVPPA
jgi:hypothetical protein